MTYRLFIDDERFPPNDGRMWEIARTMEQVKDVISRRGFPDFISFDHDLADNQPSGHEIAKWMVNEDMDRDYQFIPDGFAYYVHSQNPTGAQNIDGLLSAYLRTRLSLRGNAEVLSRTDLP